MSKDGTERCNGIVHGSTAGHTGDGFDQAAFTAIFSASEESEAFAFFLPLHHIFLFPAYEMRLGRCLKICCRVGNSGHMNWDGAHVQRAVLISYDK